MSLVRILLPLNPKPSGPPSTTTSTPPPPPPRPRRSTPPSPPTTPPTSPPSTSPPAQGKLLQLLAETQRPHRILEIGTLGGYSTICLARALPPNGKLITLELDPKHAKVALANIAHAGLSHLVELRLGPALDSLAQLHAEHAEPFDLIFLDANKDGYPDYLTAALPLTRPGTLILADNVIRDGEILDPATPDPNVQGVRRFFDLLSTDPASPPPPSKPSAAKATTASPSSASLASKAGSRK